MKAPIQVQRGVEGSSFNEHLPRKQAICKFSSEARERVIIENFWSFEAAVFDTKNVVLRRPDGGSSGRAECHLRHIIKHQDLLLNGTNDLYFWHQ